jgi:hypothetical protein
MGGHPVLKGSRMKKIIPIAIIGAGIAIAAGLASGVSDAAVKSVPALTSSDNVKALELAQSWSHEAYGEDSTLKSLSSQTNKVTVLSVAPADIGPIAGDWGLTTTSDHFVVVQIEAGAKAMQLKSIGAGDVAGKYLTIVYDPADPTMVKSIALRQDPVNVTAGSTLALK